MKKRKNKNLNKNVIPIFLNIIALIIIGFVLGTSYLSFKQQKEDINNYQEGIQNLDTDEKDNFQNEIDNYNTNIENNIDGVNIIGYIDIPSISCYLPIYNNTKNSSLLKGACRVESSGIPSLNTAYHMLLAGHSGYTGRTLFTNLSKIEHNDLFYVTILDKTYEYEVIEIKKVLPEELENIETQENDEKVSLFTCTPFYINSHRLVVTRIFYTENIHLYK